MTWYYLIDSYFFRACLKIRNKFLFVQVEKVVSELAGKNLEELLAEGKEKISSVPSGGGGAAAPAAGGAAAAAAPKVI